MGDRRCTELADLPLNRAFGLGVSNPCGHCLSPPSGILDFYVILDGSVIQCTNT